MIPQDRPKKPPVSRKSFVLAKAPTLPLAIAPAPDSSPGQAAAFAFLQKLGDELGSGPLNLPCFPDVVPRVRQALADPSSTSDDIVRIAGTEPRLAARILQTANSVVFNPSGSAFSDLRHAVTRLGHHLVQSVTMAFALQQLRAEPSLRPVAKQLNALWEKSIAVASICQVIADRLRVPTDKVFLTGLLHGIGYFYIMVRAGERSSGIDLDPEFVEFVTERHPAVGRAVMEKWGFEVVMCEAVGQQHDYQRVSKRAADITDVLIASVFLADALLERQGDLARCAGVTAFAALSFRDQELRAILRHTELALESLRDALGR
ncbi:MAG: HDOD domain-containing protein [Steroidobacteraceae bacterium]